MVHEEYSEMIAARALGALDEGEVRALEAHLETCSDCLSAMDEFQDAAALLAFEAKPMEPSSQVRTRLLDAIKASDSVSTDHQKNISSGSVVQMPARPARVWTPAQTWGAIAAGLAIVALAVSLFVVWRQNQSLRQQIAEQQSILTAPGARMAELSGTQMAPSARGTIAFDPAGRAVLITKSLPPPPTGQAYQLWFISGGQKIPGKVFTTNKDGEGALIDRIPSHALNSSVFAITLEPEGGATQPTGQIYLVSGT
jgi:anti-sigma-K factor RskA